MSRHYITTAIDYPNAAPHMGHVLEKVLADVCARWMRLRGDDVRFQIGTDEHGIKIQQTAQKEGITPRDLVDRNVPLFQDLYKRLNVSFDYFIRTSDQKVHWPTVIELWKKLQKAGALEKRTYTGLYCAGCERFMTKKDLVDASTGLSTGLCPIHQKAPEEVKEENWFFLLSREGEWLKKLLTRGVDQQRYQIVPDFRAPETLSLIEQGLEDVSFSRPKSSLSWGVPVPGDEDQTMYVWCDALTNYISSLGYFTDHEDRTFWEDAEVTHVIGKDIARFHALYWPAMLKNSGVRAPDRLLIHGFLTSEGEKMSKSIGNVVVPQEVIDKYGVDPLRFYLSHEIPVGNDGDFSWKRFGELYDAMLRHQIGNLLNRVLVMLKKEGKNISVPDRSSFQKISDDQGNWGFYWNQYESYFGKWKIKEVIETVMSLAVIGNVGMDRSKPWTLTIEEKLEVLSYLAEILRHMSLMLLPFIPETAQKMAKQLNLPYADRMLNKDFVITKEMKMWGGQKDWKKVGEPEILFAPVL